MHEMAGLLIYLLAGVNLALAAVGILVVCLDWPWK